MVLEFYLHLPQKSPSFVGKYTIHGASGYMESMLTSEKIPNIWKSNHGLTYILVSKIMIFLIKISKLNKSSANTYQKSPSFPQLPSAKLAVCELEKHQISWVNFHEQKKWQCSSSQPISLPEEIRKYWDKIEWCLFEMGYFCIPGILSPVLENEKSWYFVWKKTPNTGNDWYTDFFQRGIPEHPQCFSKPLLSIVF